MKFTGVRRSINLNEKIPFYNIINMLLIGFVFTGFIIILFFKNISVYIPNINDYIKGISFETIVTASCLAIIYEIGFIINRISSVITETILKHFKLIPFNNDYKKFNDRKKQYPIMEILSREYALSRNSLTLFLILMIISISIHNFKFSLLFFFITLLFYFSTRKHSTKIAELMKD